MYSDKASLEDDVDDICPPVKILFQAQEDSSIDLPRDQWSSLILDVKDTNAKKLEYEKRLYAPGSGEICSKYIGLSSSTVERHPYYKYPEIVDPGIMAALLASLPAVVYPEDGQELFLTLCEDMSTHPVRIFHRLLLTKKVNLSYYGLTQKAFRAMCLALMLNKHVEVLDFTDNWMQRDACFHLGEMLTKNVTIKELILSGCRIGPEGAQVLFHHLRKNNTLTKLDVSRNQLQDKGAEYLATAIFYDSLVLNINLSHNELTYKTLLAFNKVLEIRNKITHLDLSFNKITSAKAILELCNLLIQNKQFRSLNLSWSGLIGPGVGTAIKILLVNAESLEFLILNNNRLSYNAIASIASGLSKIKSKIMDTLDLSHNPLSPSDALTLLKPLKKRRVRLQSLLLDDVMVETVFVDTLQDIRSLPFRTNIIITHGYVRTKVVHKKQDKELLLKRACAVGRSAAEVKDRADFVQVILQLHDEDSSPVPLKDFLKKLRDNKVYLDGDLVDEMAKSFAGPKTEGNVATISYDQILDYVKRLWPDKKLELKSNLPVQKSVSNVKKRKEGKK